MAVLASDQGSRHWGWGRGLGQPGVSGCAAPAVPALPCAFPFLTAPDPPALEETPAPSHFAPLSVWAPPCRRRLSSLVLVSVCGASSTLLGLGALGWMPAALRLGDTLLG